MEEDILKFISLGPALGGSKDQYADGKMAALWGEFTGDRKSRTQNYKHFFIDILRRNGCKKILDAACGTGIDSIMLLEEGFEVVSTDGSDKMLKYALETRWNRRKEPAFDKWVIQEANWVTLYDDIQHLVGDGFDAVLCLGGSFGNLIDCYGDQREQKQALKNFEKCLKPGGFLIIDHRNYEYIIDGGEAPCHNVYYNSKRHMEIKPSVLYVGGKPVLIHMDYLIDLSSDTRKPASESKMSKYRLLHYPFARKNFSKLLQEAFGKNSRYEVFGDFKPLGEIENPAYYIHLVKKNILK